MLSTRPLYRRIVTTDAPDARLLCLLSRLLRDRLRRFEVALPWQRELRDRLRRRSQAMQGQRQQAALRSPLGSSRVVDG